jgi:hypothetical protein
MYTGDGTHSIKQKVYIYCKWGGIPIEKNIIVVDEQGNQYEATYPKRAKGLVKNGRARFVDENRICLACPPNKNLEDIIMDNKIETTAAIASKPLELNMEYVLKRIDQILNENGHIYDAISTIKEMKVNESPIGGQGDEAKGRAIAQTVQSREATNQQLIKLLEKMYDDIKPMKGSLKSDGTAV